jgi:glycosyltransferase involved in cell wall biosynthesis
MQRYGGISRYFYELAEGINKQTNIKASIVAPFHINEYLKSLKSSRLMGNYYSGKHSGGRSVLKYGRKTTLPFMYRALGTADVLHETYYSDIPHGDARARVITVYDMIHEVSAGTPFSLDEATSINKAIAVNRADHVICISEATRRDLVELFGVDKLKTSVIHLGYSLVESRSNNQLQITHDKPFLLYVGNRGGYKNFKNLCRAYANSNPLRREFDLVAFGGGMFSESEKNLFRELQVYNCIRQIDGDDRLLAAYYKNASLFVYPSLYEGFGIPPLEAMNYSCPVACSHSSSIPEVVGDAGCYFDPQSVESIRHGLEELAFSTSLQSTLKQRGRNRIKLFSWDKCVSEHEKLYRSLF